jgi:Bax protein
MSFPSASRENNGFTMTDAESRLSQLPTRDLLVRIGLPLVPLLIVAIILIFLPRLPDYPWLSDLPRLSPVQASSPERLQDTFSDHAYEWPPSGPVPPLSVNRFPEGMDELGSDERKSLFFRTLLPLILYENERISAERAGFLRIHERLDNQADAALSPDEQALVDQLWMRYRIDGELQDRSSRERLLRRLDVIPASLALAQAANESGWGTSRFTREANNLFGEWTWNEDIGLLPQRRVEGATHFIRIFPDLHGSVRSYIHNLNIGHAYSSLRQLRASMRQQGESPDGLRLAGGLERYSERGEDYIREVRSMIHQNELQDLPDDLRLDSGAARPPQGENDEDAEQ